MLTLVGADLAELSSAHPDVQHHPHGPLGQDVPFISLVLEM